MQQQVNNKEQTKTETSFIPIVILGVPGAVSGGGEV